MILLIKKNHVIETTEDFKMFLLEIKNGILASILFIASVTETAAATAFVHRDVSNVFQYHVAVLQMFNICGNILGDADQSCRLRHP